MENVFEQIAEAIRPQKKENIKEKNKDVLQEVKTLYFDENVIIESGISLRRLDYNNRRNYFTVNSETNQLEKIYTSVTTFCKEVMPTNDGLLMWMKNKTAEEQSAILKSSAAYGTLMDILFNQLIISGEVKDIETQVFKFTMSEGLYSIDQKKWTEQLKRDCLSFAQFIKDYDVKPILVSCPLTSDSLGIAGTLDLLCEMNEKILTKTDIKKGVENKRIKAIIDYKAKIGDMTLKSDRNSFYDSECLQLQLYKMLTREVFDSISIDAVYNFSPKNWRTNPDYNLKHWNNSAVYSRMERKFKGYYDNWLIDNEGAERQITMIEDSISLTDFESQFKAVSITDFINQKLVQEEKK